MTNLHTIKDAEATQHLVSIVRVALKYHKIHFGKEAHAELYGRFPKVGKSKSWESAPVVTDLIVKKFEEQRPVAAKKLKATLDAMRGKLAGAGFNEGDDSSTRESAENAATPIVAAQDSAEAKPVKRGLEDVLPSELRIGDTIVEFRSGCRIIPEKELNKMSKDERKKYGGIEWFSNRRFEYTVESVGNQIVCTSDNARYSIYANSKQQVKRVVRS